MGRWLVRGVGVLVCLLMTTAGKPGVAQVGHAGPAHRDRTFVFAAAGDHGANPRTAAALRLLDGSAAEFYLALGDLDYDQTPTDRAWCRYVKRHLPRKGATFPFQVLVGNHEQDGGADGRIRNHARCLPDRLGSRAGPGPGYGTEYAFTYPRQNPYAKVIMISPNLTVGGERLGYRPGSPHRRWLVGQIDRARADGIRWVIVGLHYPCLSTGATHGCDSGPEVLNLLVRKQVDLVLSGHNHIYERSKQLQLGRGSCDRIVPGRYNADCVVDNRRNRVYGQGAGTLLVTAGSFGGREQGTDPRDSERRYFARVDGDALGFVRYVVTPDRIGGRFLATGGSVEDDFRIVRR
jgi:hypothetical protein